MHHKIAVKWNHGNKAPEYLVSMAVKTRTIKHLTNPEYIKACVWLWGTIQIRWNIVLGHIVNEVER